MEVLVFHSTDPVAVREFCTRAYAPTAVLTELGAVGPTRVHRTTLGAAVLDRIDSGFGLRIRSRPRRAVCVCRVEHGRCDYFPGHPPREPLHPGQVLVLTEPALTTPAVTTTAPGARLQIARVHPALLARLAEDAGAGRLRLRAQGLAIGAPGRRLDRGLEHLYEQSLRASTPAPGTAPVAARYLGALLLDAFTDLGHNPDPPIEAG